jgi:hypothetical protein
MGYVELDFYFYDEKVIELEIKDYEFHNLKICEGNQENGQKRKHVEIFKYCERDEYGSYLNNYYDDQIDCEMTRIIWENCIKNKLISEEDLFSVNNGLPINVTLYFS